MAPENTLTEAEIEEAVRRRELARRGGEPAAIFVPEVPDEPAPIRGGAPKASLEGWLVFAFFAIAYGVIGYFFLTDGHIVSFDALHRVNDAYMVWWNSPPKLAAISLNAAPLGAVAFMPFTLIKPLATSLIALPVLTAVASGLLMAIVNSILRRCEVAPAFRFAMLLLFGLNPMLVFYAGNGEPVVLGMVMAAIGLLSVISWQITGETRHLVGAGLAIGVAVMIDYGYALWAVGFAIAIMCIGSGKGVGQNRLRSSLILFLTPVLYALLVWVLLNWVLLGSPFGWITAQTGFIQVNTTGVLQAVTSSPLDALGDLAEVVLGVAPLGFATLILLLFVGATRRDSLAWGLFFVAIFAVAVPVIRVLVADQADMMDLAVGLPLAVFALAGAAYVHYTEPGWRVGVGAVMIIGLIAALPLGWNAMKNYEYQNQAQAFTRWVEDRDSQEGTESVGGYTVGIDPELAMAEYINEELPQKKNSILVDENFSYGVMILSGRPQLFADRADRGEGVWESTKDDPFGKVEYMLVTTSRAGDQLRKQWPQMISGGEPGFTPIFRTDRYVLVEVAPTRPVDEGDDNEENQPQSRPRPVTPARPPAADSDAPSESTSATAGESRVSGPQSTPTTTTPSDPAPAIGSGTESSAPQLEGE